MKQKNILSIDERKSYTLTQKGKETLIVHLEVFTKTFYDIEEMKSFLEFILFIPSTINVRNNQKRVLFTFIRETIL